MTSIAVLQCVEKGLLALDDDVSVILHEFSNAQIITGFDESGQPTFKTAENRITVRCVPHPLYLEDLVLEFRGRSVSEIDSLNKM